MSPLVVSFILRDFTGKTAAYKSQRNTVALNSYLGLSALRKLFFSLVSIKFDKGGNSLPKHFERAAHIRSNL